MPFFPHSAAVPETAAAMLAKDGERVPFYEEFQMTGAVETWLTRLVARREGWVEGGSGNWRGERVGGGGEAL